MTYKENIKSILQCCFTGFKDEIIEGATNRILDQEQEPNITWVTGADGAKIAFKDVPAWKVTKICEILVEPQESEE